MIDQVATSRRRWICVAQLISMVEETWSVPSLAELPRRGGATVFDRI